MVTILADFTTLQTELRNRDIVLSLGEQGNLISKAVKGSITPELASAIKAHKEDLITLLNNVPTSQVVEPPLICRKCHETRVEYWKINLLRNRWVCCNCGTLSHLVTITSTTPRQIAQDENTTLAQEPLPARPEQVEVTPERVEATPEQEPAQAERNTDELPVIRPQAQEENKPARPYLGTVHAVLTDNALIWVTPDVRKLRTLPIEQSPAHIGEICTLANTYDINHVWIMPDTELARRATKEFITCANEDTWDVFSTYTDVKEPESEQVTQYPAYARIWRKNISGPMSRQVQVGFPERGSWDWIMDKPVTILATIDYLERVLGVPVEWSPGHMGTELVTVLNRTAKRQAWVRESDINLNDLPFNKAARDIVWKATQLDSLLPGLFVHQYDKRSAYLSACPGVNVGAGNPVHLTDCSACDVSLPGIYRVTSDKAHSVFDENTLPPIINTEWVTSDVLTYARSKGYEVTVHECYQWTEKHRTLESYATKLWNSRRIFREDMKQFPHTQGRENAENTMKQIALIATGKFAYEKATRFLRPDWWACVVGKTRENILRNLFKLFEQGYTPVLIYSDSVYFVSSERNPQTAVPGILDRQTELGGYRHEGTWKITPELINQFQTQKPGKVQLWLENAPKISEVNA